METKPPTQPPRSPAKASRKTFLFIVAVLVVLFILLLLTVVTGIGKSAMSNALINKARTQIKLFEIKLEEYQADHGEFPLGDGSPTSSGSLYDAFYQNGIRSGSKVYMPELDSKYSDSFRGQIRGGLILDPFKHGRPYFYLRAYDASGTMVKGAENPNFDLWSVGPDGVGRGDRGATAAELADDITNW